MRFLPIYRPMPRVCLVVLPFAPGLAPALGASLLKSVLERAEVRTDVFYGAFPFHDVVLHDLSAEEAVLLYGVISTYSDLGEHLFADALWGPRDDPALRERTEDLRARPDLQLRRQFGGGRRYDALVARIPELARRTPEFIAACRDARDWSRYDVVGFSSTFCQNVSSLALAREIKQVAPDVHVLFGGANCEGEMGRQILASFPQVDTVLQGEADTTIVSLVHALAGHGRLAEVPGALFRDDDGAVRAGPPPRPRVDMDALPVPDFSDFFEQRDPELAAAMDAHGFGLPIETSRGCWWGAIRHCVFCGLNPTSMAFRAKSPARAVSEFEELQQRYGVRRFYASDNILDRRYIDEVLPRLEEKKLDVFYETKSNLTESDVAQLARAGVRRIQPGIESLSTDLLRRMNKGAPAYRNLELLKWCRTYDVHPLWFLMYGFADEPEASYEWILSILDRLTHLPPPKRANPVTLDRYSPYFDRRDEYGIRALAPLPHTRIYYRGVDEKARFGLSYHFVMSLPQGDSLSYAPALHAAVGRWQREAAAGAALHQFRGGDATLLLDLRGSRPDAFLLEGEAHTVHEALRTACTEQDLDTARRAHSGGADHGAADESILRAADALRADRVPSLPNGRLIDELDARRLTLEVDGRVLGLAVDCTSPVERLRLLASDLLTELPAARPATYLGHGGPP